MKTRSMVSRCKEDHVSSKKLKLQSPLDRLRESLSKRSKRNSCPRRTRAILLPASSTPACLLSSMLPARSTAPPKRIPDFIEQVPRKQKIHAHGPKVLQNWVQNSVGPDCREIHRKKKNVRKSLSLSFLSGLAPSS